MRILINALRRKRPSPILTDEDHTSFSSGGDHHHHQHELIVVEEEEIDKENEVPTPRIGNKSSKAISSPSYNGDDIGVVDINCADDDDDPTTREGIKESRDDGDDIGVELRRQSHSPEIESIYTEDFTQNSEVAYASRSRSVSDELEEESTDTNSFVASIGEVTEVSDDGILRDDEGNPIDQTEVEEIMLRDEAGNIIDPRTLLLRDSFISDGGDDEQDEEDNIDVINYSSSWDHYLYERRSQESCIISSVSSDEILYEDEHQEVVYKNKNGRVSFVVDQGDEAADSDESIHLISSGSDDESTLGSDTIPDEENGGETASCVHNKEEEEANVQYEVDAENSKHSSCDTSSQEDGLKAPPPSSPREKSAKYENEIRGRRRGRGGHCISSRHQQDEYVHVIFHNKLTTLEEERRDDSPSDYTECNSVSEESEEQDNTAALLLAEKYIRARWEYSLQVMNLGCIGGGMSGALIDARDEINDMLRPSNTIPDDSSVEVEGEI